MLQESGAILFIFVAITWLICLYLGGKRKQGKLAPGPWGLPFFGYMPFITKEPYKKFVELTKRFNSGVLSIYLGNRYTVVLNDYPAIKEALFQDACLGRPHGSAFVLLTEAISMNDLSGPCWRENRRTTIKILKALGFDGAPMETQTKFEVQEFIEVLKNSNGHTFDFHAHLTSSVSNNITSLVFGERLPYEDKRRRLLDDYINCISTFFKQTSLHACFPWMKNLLYFFKVLNYDQAKYQLQRFLNHVQFEIDGHKENTDENSMKDYIDGYLKAMSKSCSHSGTSYLSTRFLKGNIRSLFGAGTEPVRCTLEWCLICMAQFLDVQEKIHHELDTVLGKDQIPSFQDSTRTPFTTAAIYEVMRWLAIVPFSHIRMAMEETSIQGHVIPKGAIILMNFYAVHSDPSLWNDPEKFQPERFINQDGKPFRPEYFLPFGLGKRSCPGESMVYIELYIYFATIMQYFDVLPPENESITFDFTLGIAKQPRSSKLRFLPRCQTSFQRFQPEWKL